jgi:hypothetical protein
MLNSNVSGIDAFN